MSFPVRFFCFTAVFLFIMAIPVVPQANQRPTVVRGVVVDGETNDPLPFASVMFDSFFKNGTATDDEGLFKIVSTDTVKALKITCLGYEPMIYPIEPGKNQYISIKMQPTMQQLAAVVVQGKRKRYRNKNNMAVELINKVIDNKTKNRAEFLDYLEYEKYQKIVFSFDNISDDLKNNRLLQPFRFIFDNVDTAIAPGKVLHPVFLKESLSDFYFRKRPYAFKEVIKAEKIVRFDEYVNRRSVAASISYLYQDINIYNNNIMFLSNQFLSPIATLAPSFYKFFIRDTSVVDGIKCVKLSFEPRSKTDMLFQGDMYVTLDSAYAVKSIDMTVNKDINLNWVRHVSIAQKFEKTEGAGWLLTHDDMAADFGITQGSAGLFGKRSAFSKGFKLNQPVNDSIYNVVSPFYTHGSEDRDTAYWNRHRYLALRASERNIYLLMDSLRDMPEFKRDMSIINTVTAGYLKAGWFEFGPVYTFYSYNPVEGSRVKFGGRTTSVFSKKLNVETYMAYGFTDEKYKSYLGLTYSLTDRTIYEYPVKSLKASYQYDIKIPGQDLQFAQADNLLLSFKRGTNDKMYYHQTYQFEHVNEFTNHFSYKLSYEYSRKSPAGNLYFNNVSYQLQTNTTASFDVSQVGIALRYAPHEKFFQGSMYRTPFPNKYPVLELRYAAAAKMIGSDYNFQTLNLNVSKRFNLSVLGYTDVNCEGGKVFGRAPYLLLDIHRANQTYAYQALSYNLMNFLEFVSDQYVAVNIDHCFNGFLFNKIPLMKRLMFREVVTCKVLYGGLSRSNNPVYHPDLFKFPVNMDGAPLTHTLEAKPYIEAGFGVSNILRFLRIDFVQRISYLDHPGISKSGIRAGLKFDF